MEHWSYKTAEVRALGARKAAATRRANRLKEALELLND
jgi:hypothetical protein